MQWTDESIAFLRGAAAMNRYYETVAERITPQLTENAHICDAGCGIGELSLALKPCHGGGRRRAGHQNAGSSPDKRCHRDLRRYGDACAGEALRRDGVLPLWPHAGYITHREKAVPRKKALCLFTIETAAISKEEAV